MLQSLGGELAYFSPTADGELPGDISGLYLCGGYPELHKDELTANGSMCRAIKNAVNAGLPTIAECGGFIYLHYAKVIGGNIRKREKLQRFGYIEMTAKRDNLLCKAGERIRSHEFHYCDSDNSGADFAAVKPISGKAWDCAHATETMYAGFPHLYFPANPAFAANFVKGARRFDSL